MSQQSPSPTTPTTVDSPPPSHGRPTTTGEERPRSAQVLRRTIAIVIVVAFGLAAIGGIIVLLGDIESEATYNVISTTALTGAVSVAAFCGATLIGRRTQWFGVATIGVAVITLALSLWFLWGDPYMWDAPWPGADALSIGDIIFRILGTSVLLTSVGAVSSLILLLTQSPSRVVMIGLPITLCLLTFGTALFLVIIWFESAWEIEWLTRLNGIVWILAAFGVVVVPLSSLLLKAGSKPVADVSPDGAEPVDPTLSSSAVDRLEAAARAEGITADELVDRLLVDDSQGGADIPTAPDDSSIRTSE